MQIYRVGGAVRDQLLGLSGKDIDWVVVGATPQQMLDCGYTQVGRDFPVFLHPETKQEYALARTERKTASGYTGFTVHSSPDVTLEQDLARRDLTINAIAQNSIGELIDPYKGQADIAAKVLRHITPAFREDPLRVLRLARFAARFFPLGFSVAAETRSLLGQMVSDGELRDLVAERVWTETERALAEADPTAYFDTLADCGALDQLFPELDSGWRDSKSGARAMLAAVAQETQEPLPRFAALFVSMSNDQLSALSSRLKIGHAYVQLANMFIAHRETIHRFEQLDAEHKLQLLEATDVLRRPERVESLLMLCRIHWQLFHAKTQDYRQEELFHSAIEAITSVSSKAFLEQGLQGKEIARAIRQNRLLALSELRLETNSN